MLSAAAIMVPSSWGLVFHIASLVFFCGVVGNGDFRASLQMKHGAAFTSKLETMITDRNMSFDLMNDFKKWSRSLTLPIREFQAFVRCVVGCFLFSPR